MMLSVAFYLLSCLMSLCWVSLCWVSLCWVSLCWLSLCRVLYRQKYTVNCKGNMETIWRVRKIELIGAIWVFRCHDINRNDTQENDTYHVRYLSTLLHKQIQQLSSYNSDPLHSKDGATFVPKLADPPFCWKSNSTTSKTGSHLTDLDQLIFCTI